MVDSKVITGISIGIGVIAGVVIFWLLDTLLFHGSFRRPLISLGIIVGGTAGYFVGEFINDISEEGEPN
jgi:hypothetical protein